MSASTENAPVYNVIQSSFQTNTNDFKEFSKYKICSLNDGGQSTIFSTQILIATLNEEAIQCQFNTSSLQNICLNVQQKQRAIGL